MTGDRAAVAQGRSRIYHLTDVAGAGVCGHGRRAVDLETTSSALSGRFLRYFSIEDAQKHGLRLCGLCGRARALGGGNLG